VTPKTNVERVWLWIRRAIPAAAGGAVIGLLIGLAILVVEKASKGSVEIEALAIPFVAAMYGAFFFAVPPLAIAGWFLLLRMIEQVADAAKGSPKE
jgi:hypothetical protein